MHTMVMVFNATFNNISAISQRSVLLKEENGVPGENHRPAASHWQTLSHNVVLSTPHLNGIRTIGTDWIGSCKIHLPYKHDNDGPDAYNDKCWLQSDGNSSCDILRSGELITTYWIKYQPVIGFKILKLHKISLV